MEYYYGSEKYFCDGVYLFKSEKIHQEINYDVTKLLEVTINNPDEVIIVRNSKYCKLKNMSIIRVYDLSNIADFLYVCQNISADFFNFYTFYKFKIVDKMTDWLCSNSREFINKCKFVEHALSSYCQNDEIGVRLLNHIFNEPNPNYTYINLYYFDVNTCTQMTEALIKYSKNISVNFSPSTCVFTDIIINKSKPNVNTIIWAINNFIFVNSNYYYQGIGYLHNFFVEYDDTDIFDALKSKNLITHLEPSNVNKKYKCDKLYLRTLINVCCELSCVNVLNWLKSNYHIYFNNFNLETSSLKSLKWLKKNKLKIIYDPNIIFTHACQKYGQNKMLAIELIKYLINKHKKIDLAKISIGDNYDLELIKVLYSLFSDFMEYFSEEIIYLAMNNGDVDILSFMVEKNAHFKYSAEDIKRVCSFENINVLDWFKETNLEILYDDNIVLRFNSKISDWFLKNQPEIFTQQNIDTMIINFINMNDYDGINWIEKNFDVLTNITRESFENYRSKISNENGLIWFDFHFNKI